MNIISIDCGASFVKGAFFKNGNLILQQRRAAPLSKKEADIFQPTQIIKLVSLVQDMILELAGEEKEIVLCLSNEMHGFLLAYQDGTPFTDYISWQMEFGKIPLKEGATSQDILRGLLPREIKASGMPLRAGLPSSNLLYLYKNDFLENAKKQLYFYTLGDYLIKRISGKEPICHPTNAAATGLYDLWAKDWNKKLTTESGGKNIIFPQIKTSGWIDFILGGIAFHALPAIGDQQAALLGSELKEEFQISFNLGTGAQVSKITANPYLTGNFQIRPYFFGKFIKTIPHLPCGRALNVYIRFFMNVLEQFKVKTTEDQVWESIIDAERKAVSSGMKCDLSFFENAASMQEGGSITGIEEYSFTMGSLMRSVFKQMADNFVMAAEVLEPNKHEVKNLVFSGGVAKRLLAIRQQIIQQYGEGISVTVAENETLWGLCYYGGNETKKFGV